MSAQVGRPPLINNNEPLEVRPTPDATRLQRKSIRRDVLNVMLEVGCPITIDQLNEHFGSDVRSTVMALVRSGWVSKAELAKEQES